MRVVDVETLEELALERLGFVLTLESEPGISFARGTIHTLGDDLTYPIQSSAALLDALLAYLGRTRRSE
jgi:hypothetical protein